MLADSAAFKLRAKVRNMSSRELESEDGLRDVARLQAHDEAKAAANGVKLRTTGLKRAISARLPFPFLRACGMQFSPFPPLIFPWVRLRRTYFPLSFLAGRASGAIVFFWPLLGS